MTTINNIAVVGAGTVGLSWAAFYAHAGLTVTVTDPRPDTVQLLAEALPDLARSLGTDHETLAPRISVCSTLAEALQDADLVQENGPEKLGLKQELFAQIAQAAPRHALLTSSSSGLVPTGISERLDDAAAARVLIAHPFNPAQLMPLVELVGGQRTTEDSLNRAEEFYASVGKNPVRVHREINGFVANRLQEAVLDESFRLVTEGVVSVAELDTVMKSSLGPRWATVGPLEGFHLGGGPGGARHMAAHLGKGVTGKGHSIDDQQMTELVHQIEATYGSGPEAYKERSRRRDARQNAISATLTTIDTKDE